MYRPVCPTSSARHREQLSEAGMTESRWLVACNREVVSRVHLVALSMLLLLTASLSSFVVLN